MRLPNRLRMRLRAINEPAFVSFQSAPVARPEAREHAKSHRFKVCRIYSQGIISSRDRLAQALGVIEFHRVPEPSAPVRRFTLVIGEMGSSLGRVPRCGPGGQAAP